ncbi:CAAX prenyl protease-related protein [Desulfonema magnum]|uniref:CAAX prenyl protease-related protein n=1 Tax=Desulfonema magnum TaxID=45655 RepID=A0A975BX69_9BACT|nr:CAAX prenyl protease-related protein [Desulfonema magnum]QTA93007.1 CAAX prenyl protease-related protein [Desulfonema magnum]
MAAYYVLPFALYVILTQIPPAFPSYYPWLYAAVVLVVGTVTGYILITRQLIRPHRNVIAGVSVGLAGIVLWIWLSGLGAEQYVIRYLPDWLIPKPRAAFNPFESLPNPAVCRGFVGIRLIGLVLVVPIAEELFWRGFLMRWVISQDWENQEIGQFTPGSFLWVVVLFTLAHPEWLAAAVYCALLNGLIYWKRDLWNCVVAHGVSNLGLGIYVLVTGTWALW